MKVTSRRLTTVESIHWLGSCVETELITAYRVSVEIECESIKSRTRKLSNSPLLNLIDSLYNGSRNSMPSLMMFPANLDRTTNPNRRSAAHSGSRPHSPEHSLR